MFGDVDEITLFQFDGSGGIAKEETEDVNALMDCIILEGVYISETRRNPVENTNY